MYKNNPPLNSFKLLSWKHGGTLVVQKLVFWLLCENERILVVTILLIERQNTF